MIRWRRGARSLVPWIFFLGITIAVVYPWFLRPGYLFLLDFVWTPVLPAPAETLRLGILSSLPHRYALWLLATVFPTPLLQKVFFSLPFWLAGVSMYHLTQALLAKYWSRGPIVASLAAGLFYMLNTFVVTRVFMGQAYLLLAYALTPWVVLAFWRFVLEPTRQRALVAATAAVTVILINLHHVILLGLLLLPVAFIKRPSRRNMKPWLLFLVPCVATILAIIMVYYQASPETRSVANPRGPWARALRAPYSDNFVIDGLLLTATWKLDLPFALPYEQLPLFGYGMALLLGIMAVGFYWLWTSRDHGLAAAFFTLLAISLFLAIGVAHPLTRDVATWLYGHVPFWIVMRDSAKLLALVALVESIYLGVGIAYLWKHRRVRPLAAGGLVVVGLLISPALGGFTGQITPRPYPQSWQALDLRLGARAPLPRLLFLPWHLYMPFSFSDDRTVVNPAPAYFHHATVISSQNSEVDSPDTTFATENLLRERLGADDIEYVAVAMDTIDGPQYAMYMQEQGDYRLVFDSQELRVWGKTNTPAL